MYETFAKEKLQSLKRKGQYRDFVTINRIRGRYPLAYVGGDTSREVVVWCSNDYLGMSQHPAVV